MDFSPSSQAIRQIPVSFIEPVNHSIVHPGAVVLSHPRMSFFIPFSSVCSLLFPPVSSHLLRMIHQIAFMIGSSSASAPTSLRRGSPLSLFSQISPETISVHCTLSALILLSIPHSLISSSSGHTPHPSAINGGVGHPVWQSHRSLLPQSISRMHLNSLLIQYPPKRKRMLIVPKRLMIIQTGLQNTLPPSLKERKELSLQIKHYLYNIFIYTIIYIPL